MLERLALSRFEVGFALVHNGKTVWSLPPATTQAQRLARVSKLCGDDFAAHVIELRQDGESLRLSGWLALPTFSRSQSDLQFAFLNGRFVRDKLIAGAARLAYQDVLFNGRFGAYVLYLDVDPGSVDVNAHPQKLEVRFRESRRVHDFMFRTLERALAATRPSAESPGSAPLDWLTGSARHANVAAPSQARFVLPEGQPNRAAADVYRSLVGESLAGRGADWRVAPKMRRGVRYGRVRAGRATPPPRATRCTRRSGSPWRSCMESTFWLKPRTAWCWWTCTRRTSA